MVLFAISIEILKTLKCHTCSKKTWLLSIISTICFSKDEKIFKEQESIEILCLIKNIKLL